MTEITRIKCGNGNSYIVSNGNNAILVDTCKTKYKDKIASVCKSYKIRLILLTHGHFDHIQNAAFLSKELDAPIAMHKSDFPLINDNFSQPLFSQGFLGKIVLSASLKGFHEEKIPLFEPQIWLSEGDSLEQYGIPAEILHLPGHTDGSIAVDVEHKYLLVGDALMNMFYPTTSMIFRNESEMRKSAKRITSLGKRIIFFGHGKPVSNRKWIE